MDLTLPSILFKMYFYYRSIFNVYDDALKFGSLTELHNGRLQTSKEDCKNKCVQEPKCLLATYDNERCFFYKNGRLNLGSKSDNINPFFQTMLKDFDTGTYTLSTVTCSSCILRHLASVKYRFLLRERDQTQTPFLQE